MTLLISCYQIFVVVSFELFLFIFCVCVCQERTIAKKTFQVDNTIIYHSSTHVMCDIVCVACVVCRHMEKDPLAPHLQIDLEEIPSIVFCGNGFMQQQKCIRKRL